MKMINVLVTYTLLNQHHLGLVVRKRTLLHANNKGEDQTVQSDQRLCYSLSGKPDGLICYMRNFKILASLCS